MDLKFTVIPLCYNIHWQMAGTTYKCKKVAMQGIEPMQGTQGMWIHCGGDNTLSAKRLPCRELNLHRECKECRYMVVVGTYAAN